MFKLIDRVDSSIDSVTKYILEDSEFGKNEVSILYKNDKTIFCLPTQTNCKMGCVFCHLTGTTRPAKNLSSKWIVSVVNYLINNETLHTKLINSELLISFMGVGEPLLNVTNLMGSIDILHHKHQHIRFAISTMMPNTSAIFEMIDWLTYHVNYRVKVHLSLHGVTNRELIVINSKVNTLDAIKALQRFHVITKNPIEYHYTLVSGVNDSIDELKLVNSYIQDDGSTIKFLTLSETNGYTSTNLSNDVIKDIFPSNIVEFYDPPGRDVGASCGMFNKELYNT